MDSMNEPNAPATNGQTFAIFCIARFDVRHCNLSKAQAGSLIDRLKTGDETIRMGALADVAALPGAVKKGEPTKPKQDWKAVFAEAHKAGMEAGNTVAVTPMVVNTHESPPVLGPTPIIARSIVSDGVCGFAWVTVRPGNCSFAKWLVEQKLARPSGYSGGTGVKIWVHEFNQSLTRKEAFATAFSAVLNKYNINSVWGSNID